MLGVRVFALISLRLKLDGGHFLVSPKDTPAFRQERNNKLMLPLETAQEKVDYTVNETTIKCQSIVNVKV